MGWAEQTTESDKGCKADVVRALPFIFPEDADLETRIEIGGALMGGHGMCIVCLPEDWS